MAAAFTNVWIFYEIAHESYGHMQEIQKSLIRPKPNGEPGYILSLDPKKQSFKAALTAIVFAGVYLEALLHLLMVEKRGESFARSNDKKSCKDKLLLLGCTDSAILDASEHYRQIRREVVHEKAHFDNGPDRTAQVEAGHAIELIEQINVALSVSRG